MDLVRDLLDALLLDTHGRSIGRVDGIVLEVREHRPPRVKAMSVGARPLAHRLHPRLASWFGEPARIPLHTIREIGVDIELALDAEKERDLLRSEKWLVQHVIAKIPGGKRGK
jgi:hypothetical protein